MIDRIEELLALMEAEDEDEREDTAEPEEISAALPPRTAEWESRESGGEPEAAAEVLVWSDGETGDSLARAAETARLPGAAGELDGAVEAVQMARTAAQAAVRTAARRSAGTEDGPAAAGQAAEAGLEELYRQTARAAIPAAQILPGAQAAGTARAYEPGPPPQLTVDELDRAVRRDSRRYDGAMSIF